jgi:hypothetical protein
VEALEPRMKGRDMESYVCLICVIW